MKRTGRRVCHEGQDQYGDMGGSQDREERFANAASGRFSGGGSAGGSARRQSEVIYQGRVPKFLKELEHLRGYKRKQKEPNSAPQNESSDEETDQQREEEEAVHRALEENPELAKEINPVVLNKAKAVGIKEKGGEAYAKGDYTGAIRLFTSCIELDPTNEVYHSNRAAAYTNLQEYDKAIEDAKKVVALKPSWVKGHARLAAAQYGLELYPQALESYNKALLIDPDNDTLIKGRDKATEMVQRQMEENKHTFDRSRKKARTKSSSTSTVDRERRVHISYDDEKDG